MISSWPRQRTMRSPINPVSSNASRKTATAGSSPSCTVPRALAGRSHPGSEVATWSTGHSAAGVKEGRRRDYSPRGRGGADPWLARADHGARVTGRVLVSSHGVGDTIVSLVRNVRTRGTGDRATAEAAVHPERRLRTRRTSARRQRRRACRGSFAFRQAELVDGVGGVAPLGCGVRGRVVGIRAVPAPRLPLGVDPAESTAPPTRMVREREPPARTRTLSSVNRLAWHQSAKMRRSVV